MLLQCRYVQLLSFRLNPNGLLIQDGMILSNEPGYYEDGQFGIRIESLMVAKKVRSIATCGKAGGFLLIRSVDVIGFQAAHIQSPLNREFCEFETITMVPIQKKLIDVTLLTEREIKWLDAYHQEVHDKLKPLLQDDEDAYAYLVKETAPVHN